MLLSDTLVIKRRRLRKKPERDLSCGSQGSLFQDRVRNKTPRTRLCTYLKTGEAVRKGTNIQTKGNNRGRITGRDSQNNQGGNIRRGYNLSKPVVHRGTQNFPELRAGTDEIDIQVGGTKGKFGE